MTINSLAFFPPFTVAPPRWQRLLARRVVCWTLVLLIHIIMLSIFFLSQEMPVSLRRGGPIETMLDLTGVPDANVPSERVIQPQGPLGTPQVIPQPITVTPPVIPKSESPAATPGDVLTSVGQAIACGASNFENLNQAQRNRCRHIPWMGARLPTGNIVLLPQGPRFATPDAPPQIRMSGADAQRREMETSSPCPVMLNIPCLNKLPDNN